MAADPARFDVLVVGGGVMGLAIADALLGNALHGRSLRVALLERSAIGNPDGGSHGDGRIFRLAYPEREYVELARLAGLGWRELEHRVSTPLLECTGTLDCGPADGSDLTTIAANLREAGLPFERFSPGKLAKRFPQVALEAGQEALFQPEGGVIRADRALEALAREIERRGGKILTGASVMAIDAGADGLTVRLDSGQCYAASGLVLATGSWSRALTANLDLELPLAITREQVAYFAARGGLEHGLEVLPTLIDWADSMRPFYALPRVRVPGVKVGWHHAGIPIETPETESTLDRANLDAVQAFVQRRFPHLEPRPFEIVTCLYNSTPDLNFILDHLPGEPRIILATGFSGHGFKFAPAIGELVTALVTGQAPPFPLDLFRLDRLQPTPGKA